jgi:hypothetical protein
MMGRPAARCRRQKTHRKPASQRRSVVPRLENLEDRTVLSTVHALFDLSTPARGPFPSNWFTVEDGTQNTGRRVNLPLPDPVTHQSDYEDVQVINELDGFNMQPRLSIPFDGPIDVNTVSGKTVFQISLGDTLPGGDKGGEVIGINQIVWNPARNTLHVQSDELLDQHTRYALIVTQGIQDLSGHHVKSSQEFKHFVHHGQGEYHTAIVQAIEAAEEHGVPEHDIVAASVFSTESATAVLEKIRDQIHAATPAAAAFNLGANGERTVFSRDDVTGITFHQQTMADPPGFTDVQLTAYLAALDYIPGAVSEIAFGKYLSPDYEVHPGEYVLPVGTRTGTPAVQGFNDIYFNLFLPSGPKPEDGWPVAIFGHGHGKDKNDSFFLATMLAKQGIATIAINSVGHGFGPLGTLTVNSFGSGPVTFAAGGRGFDQDGDHVIETSEGDIAASPRTVLYASDSFRQTAADLMQLVRVIEVGMDVDGNGGVDLDPSRIYYVGHSAGGQYGTDFLAVEPNVHAGVLSAAGNALESLKLTVRPELGKLLASRTPSLINSPGITVLDGVSVGPPYFDDNLPLRNGIPLSVRLVDGTMRIIQSPETNNVPGAMAIQEVEDKMAWASQAGSAVAYAPHLRKAPLTGVPAKSVIFLLNKGDLSAPNPATTANLRAGDLADRTTYYRHDLAFAEDPTIPKNSHPYVISPTSSNSLVAAIARGYQEQIVTFFASDGQTIIHPEPARFFEVPIQGPLPEDLNWIVDNGPGGAAAPLLSSDAYSPTVTDSAGGSPPVPNLFPQVQLGGMAVGPGPFFATPLMSQPIPALPADGGSTRWYPGSVPVAPVLASAEPPRLDHATLTGNEATGGDGGETGIGSIGRRAGDPGYLWYSDDDGDGRMDFGDSLPLLPRFGR